MINSQGWISLHRSLQDHPLWKGEKFTKGQAWVDLLLCANHKPARLMIKNTLINLDRGQQARSQLTLSKEWKWSINKVKRFLKLLENDKMLTIQTNQQTTIISICNYSSFQDKPTTNESTNEESGEKQTRNKRITNNNVNNENNDNKKINIPYQLIADTYNELFNQQVNGSTEVQVISEKRKTAIRKIWNLKPDQKNEKTSTNNIDYWKRYFDYSSQQAGLNGGKATKDFDWIADFDALINFNKYIKNIEGGYA